MEIRMGRDMHRQQQVARRSARRSGLSLPREANHAAVFHAGWNLDVNALGLVAAANL